MSVIVKHRKTKDRYIMIGTGYGTMREEKESFYGDHLVNTDDGEVLSTKAAVCDGDGKIYWFDTSQLEVLEIDGKKIEDYNIK